jgi:transposase-like protein
MATGRVNRSRLDWEILIAEYESRSVSCAYFCKLHQVSRGNLYKWRRHFLSDKKSVEEESAFIPLVINKEEESGQKNLINITSAIKISSSSGVVVEFIAGCRYLELKAVMEILDAAK